MIRHPLRRAVACVLLWSVVLAPGCIAPAKVTIDRPPPSRPYEPGKVRPKLMVLQLDDKTNGKIKDASILGCGIEPGTTEKLRTALAEICRGSGLFADVQLADFGERELEARRASLANEVDLLLLFPTVEEFRVEGGPTITAYLIFPLILAAIVGLPVAPCYQEGELRMRCRFVDGKTGKLVSLFDTGKIGFNDSFPGSGLNAPIHVKENLEHLASNLGSSFAGSLSAIQRLEAAGPATVPVAATAPAAADERPPVKELLRWPADVTSPSAEVRLVTPPSGLAIRDIQVTVNGTPASARVRTEPAEGGREGAIIFQLDLGKGMNEVALEVVFLSGASDRFKFTIQRLR